MLVEELQIPDDIRLCRYILRILEDEGPMSVEDLNTRVAKELEISEAAQLITSRGEINPTKSIYYKKMSFIRSKLKRRNRIANDEKGYWYRVEEDGENLFRR